MPRSQSGSISVAGFSRLAANSGQERSLDAVETPSAQHGGHNRSRSPSVGDSHVPATGITIDRHLRYKRDTDTCRDHSEETAELPTLKGNVWCDSGSRTGSNAQVAKTMPV